jgi:RHS repeat-associated protein
VTASSDQTKLPVDVTSASQQIIGASSGAPGTEQNLSLAYAQESAHAYPTIEANFTLSTNVYPSAAAPGPLTATLTFNGVQQSAVYYSFGALNSTSYTIHVALPYDASSLATGRYAYTLAITNSNMSGTASISGAVNVIKGSSSAVGAGWDIPGVDRLYTNSATGVPAGVLETTGDGESWYFTQGSGNSFTSPAGDFSTLTSVTGGGWQLVDPQGTTFNFNSSGYETSRVERTGATTTYTWSSGTLTTITDPFNRSIGLAYTSGLLSSITDLASNVTSIGHTSSDLTSITLPNPGGGAPQWQYTYNSGHYLSKISDPMSNNTSYSFDSNNDISQTTLPDGKTIGASAEQGLALGSPQSGSPPNAPLITSITPSVTDADGNKSYYQTNFLGELISYTDPATNVTSWTRDSNGLVTVLTQPAPTTGGTQPVTDYSYDSLGNETAASGALATFGTWTFNSFSEPTQFTNSLSKTWSWQYNTHGALTSESDPLSNTISFTVDSNGMPLTMVQPAPNNGAGTITTSYTYDSDERLTKITFPDSSTQTFTYTTNDLLASATDENNHTTSYAYDADSRETSVTNAASGVVSYTYDKDARLLTTTDEMGNVTTNAWNSRSELTSVTLPVPVTGGTAPVWSFTYDGNGNKLTQVDPLNNTTSWAYTSLGLVSSVTLPAPATGQSQPVTSYTQDNLGRTTKITNALSGQTVITYNSNNWVTSIALPDPGGGAPTTQFGYDAIGERTTVTDPTNHVVTTAFTADGQVASVTDNANDVTSYTYGHDGELLSTSDPLSHVTSDSCNNRFWLTSTTDANSHTTQYGYDSHGNLTSLTDGDSNQDQWTYSSTNHVLSDTNQLGYARSYSYNASGDLTQETDRSGRVRQFTYDNDHRETAEKWMSGGSSIYTISYAYNADNAVTSASDPDSSYAYSFDNLGRVTSLDNSGTPNIPHVVLANQYDLMNDRTQLTATVAGTADFLNSYTYDADQRMLQATQQGQTGGNGVAPKGIGYAYNLDGQMTSVLRFDPTTSSPHPDIALGTLSYDSANRLTEIKYTHSGNTLDDLTWAYDAASRVTSFTSSVDGTASYSYDPTNQLTAATYTGTNQPANESYSFDATGNRTNTGYSTGTNNQLTSDGTFNYTYDHEGNRATRTRISSAQANDYQTTYTWDYRDRLTDVEYFNNQGTLTKHVHYVYDVWDQEIGKEVDDTGSGSYDRSEWYALDLASSPGTPALPVLQFDGNGHETYRYLNSPSWTGVDAVMAEEAITTPGSAGTTTYALADNLGNVRDIVNTSSTVVDHVIYNSFGQVAYESGTVHHWASYANGRFDPDTGLVKFGERWYDPAVGRWMSEDPISFAAGDPNVSRYVANGATNGIDPTGLEDNPAVSARANAAANLVMGFVKPPPPAVDTTSTELDVPLAQFCSAMGFNNQETQMAVGEGCEGLFHVTTAREGMPQGGVQPWNVPGALTFSDPLLFLAFVMFAGKGYGIYAYQNTQGLTADPVDGIVDPASIPVGGQKNFITGNIVAGFWQWANESNGSAKRTPIDPEDSLLGLPEDTNGENAQDFQTTVFGVYPKGPPVPVTPPNKNSWIQDWWESFDITNWFGK